MDAGALRRLYPGNEFVRCRGWDALYEALGSWSLDIGTIRGHHPSRSVALDFHESTLLKDRGGCEANSRGFIQGGLELEHR